MKKLKSIRELRGLSQSQLAKLIGVTKHSISRWETTDLMPYQENHDKLAEALKCEPIDLGEYRDSSTIIDYAGQTIGKLYVVKKVGYNKHHLVLWECKCECGETVIRSSHYLHNTKSPRCDKCPRLIKLGKVYKNVINKTYGKLTVIEATDERTITNSAYWLCRCECGNIVKKSKYYLNNSIRPMCDDCFNEYKLELYNDLYKDDTSVHRLKSILFNPKTANKSGYTGVIEKGNKWIAHITFKGKLYALGDFDNMDDAIEARKKAENDLFLTYLEKLQNNG